MKAALILDMPNSTASEGTIAPAIANIESELDDIEFAIAVLEGNIKQAACLNEGNDFYFIKCEINL